MKKNNETGVKSSRKNTKRKLENIIDFLDKNRKMIYGFVGGVLISSIVATIIWPDRIATLSDGTQPVAEINGKNITADVLYEDLKKKNDVNSLLNRIDRMLLNEIYEENEEMNTEVEETANGLYKDAASYNMTEKEFLSEYGYKTHDEFIADLKLNYLRNEYYEEYARKLVTEDEINEYYEKNVYGDINSKHMLVTIGEDRTDEDAKNLANEIIAKLNEGKAFDEVKEEYKDSITYEELGYQPFNANIQASYMNALKGLENEKYTTEPVKTTYGYHIIYRIDQKEKPSLEDAKETIINTIATEKKNADQKLLAKSLIELRKEKELKFYDTVIEEKYKDYVDLIQE